MNKFIVAIAVLVFSCYFVSPIGSAEAAKAKKHSVSARKGQHKAHRHHAKNHHHDSKHGTASWYGPKFHGRKTANGEIYDMNAMTAAHNSLPLSSYAEVTNLKNQRTVIVRINDRGPFYGNRVIDLSYAAAKKLGIFSQGTGDIKITPLAVN
ncbi:MAG: septal ring lytic transglycosylase RlpA family protein [Methylococcaceae bacterium]|nr:MAG: septal ring lytic transglycosylase RlpA family protein [Methylococcaceae bacterium]